MPPPPRFYWRFVYPLKGLKKCEGINGKSEGSNLGDDARSDLIPLGYNKEPWKNPCPISAPKPRTTARRAQLPNFWPDDPLSDQRRDDPGDFQDARVDRCLRLQVDRLPVVRILPRHVAAAARFRHRLGCRRSRSDRPALASNPAPPPDTAGRSRFGIWWQIQSPPTEPKNLATRDSLSGGHRKNRVGDFRPMSPGYIPHLATVYLAN